MNNRLARSAHVLRKSRRRFYVFYESFFLLLRKKPRRNRIVLRLYRGGVDHVSSDGNRPVVVYYYISVRSVTFTTQKYPVRIHIIHICTLGRWYNDRARARARAYLHYYDYYTNYIYYDSLTHWAPLTGSERKSAFFPSSFSR